MKESHFSLRQSFRQTGACAVLWTGQNDVGQRVSSGLYYCRLVVDGQLVHTRKMLLLR